MRWTSFFTGLLALTALDAVLSSTAAATRAGGVFGLAASAINHLMSPASPLIPDLRTTAGASTTNSTGAASITPAIVQLAPTAAAAAKSA